MAAQGFYRRHAPTALAAVILLSASACSWNAERTTLLKENEYLRDRGRAQDRLLAKRDTALVRLEQQVKTLKSFDPDRPMDAFAPVSLEIASLTRGRDYDGIPGDDGVTVHLRPKDVDGDVVKTPGTIRIQLMDNGDLEAPRVLKVYVFDRLDELRKAWHSRFGTQHYTLRCPFPPGANLSKCQRLTVTAEFVDFLTGATLTVSKDVPVSLPRR